MKEEERRREGKGKRGGNKKIKNKNEIFWPSPAMETPNKFIYFKY